MTRGKMLGRIPFVTSLLTLSGLILAYMSLASVSLAQTPTANNQAPNQPPQQDGKAAANQLVPNKAGFESVFDQEIAFDHLKAICKIGPRISTKKGMIKQQKYIERHFKTLGLKVSYQKFKARSPFNGAASNLRNMIVKIHPDKKRRLLFCCHYDTRPFADMDPVDPKAKFIGANDGASGVALLCELGRHLVKLDGKYGFDLVFF